MILFMRNWLAIAAVGAALTATPARTQTRGGHPALGGVRPAIVGHAPRGARAPFIAHGAPGFSGIRMSRPLVGGGVRFSRGFRDFDRDDRFHHHHRRFFIGTLGWPYGYYGYYAGYYPWYPFFWDTYADSYSGSTSVYNEQNYQLQQEVNQLTNEVQKLREEEAERSAPPSPPQPSPQPQSNAAPPPPATLVFRDGRTQKADNYAIAGSTVWVFTERRARKIPLSELDIPATRKVNEERGVPFPLPPSAP
jgi:hypothetical protein